MRRQAAVAGIAALPYSKNIGMTERESGSKAILAALEDAGLSSRDVDGLFRCSWEATTEMEMARILGLDGLRVFGCQDYGGGAGPPIVAQAAMAIECGVADVVVAWRARNRNATQRPWVTRSFDSPGQDQFEWPNGIVRPVDAMAMMTRVWIDRYEWPPELLGTVAINNRAHATRNPMALMKDPITMDDYLSSRWICEPLRLLDCCLESDGALALVLVADEMIPDTPQPPAYVTGFGFGSMPDQYAMSNFYGPDLVDTTARYVATELWKNTGLSPSDIDVVQWYDAFTPEVVVQFEEYGFCQRGEASEYIMSGEHPAYNTSGGNLSEAYVHGFNLLVEGVRQVRGTSTSQVPDVLHSLVTGGNVVATGAVVFSSVPW